MKKPPIRLDGWVCDIQTPITRRLRTGTTAGSVSADDIVNDLVAKLQFLFNYYIESEEGVFTFPDGDCWECKVKPKQERKKRSNESSTN